MIPPFEPGGNLPAGIHPASWPEIAARFGASSRRVMLLEGLLAALINLRDSGCRRVYIDGSFVTTKPEPGDFDGCWAIQGVDPNKVDPALLTFDDGRLTQ